MKNWTTIGVVCITTKNKSSIYFRQHIGLLSLPRNIKWCDVNIFAHYIEWQWYSLWSFISIFMSLCNSFEYCFLSFDFVFFSRASPVTNLDYYVCVCIFRIKLFIKSCCVVIKLGSFISNACVPNSNQLYCW